MSHIDPGLRAREARARRFKALRDHPFGRVADELVQTYLAGGTSEVERKLAVANWLREFLAAASFGCTGLTSDPEGPELRPHGSTIDALASGAKATAGASGTETDGLESGRNPHVESFGPDWDME